MRYPQLVPDRVCNTPIVLKLYSENIDRYGQPQITEYSGLCNYQCISQRVLDDKKVTIKVILTALFNGDIVPNMEIVGGTAEIDGETRQIEKCSKVRNPDGTVNYTRIYLK